MSLDLCHPSRVPSTQLLFQWFRTHCARAPPLATFFPHLRCIVDQSNAALQRRAHATTNKGHSQASTLQVLFGGSWTTSTPYGGRDHKSDRFGMKRMSP